MAPGCTLWQLRRYRGGVNGAGPHAGSPSDVVIEVVLAPSYSPAGSPPSWWYVHEAAVASASSKAALGASAQVLGLLLWLPCLHLLDAASVGTSPAGRALRHESLQ